MKEIPFQVKNGHFKITATRKSDRKALEKWLNDRAIYENTLRIPYPYTSQHAKDRLKRTRRLEKRLKTGVSWAIRNEEGEAIGGIGRHFLYGFQSHRDEIGYWLARPYWGKGIMTEALKAFCQYAFGHLGLIRLEASVFDFNPASAKVLEKAGFEREGLMKKAFIKDGKTIDGIMYALIRD